MMTKKSKSGFTLLEILLVVGIIAILAGIVIIAINPGKQLASVRNTQRLSDLKQLNNAITQYYIDKGTYPASTTLSTTTLTEICNTGSVSGTTTSVTGNPCGTLTNLSELVPTYIVAIPVDPSGASSSLSFIPTAYANINGTGYKIMRTLANQIVEQAPLAELSVPVAIGTVPTVPWVPITGLLAHWKLNDNAANTTVVDNTGTYNGTANFNTNAKTVAGMIGSALSFDGGSNFIQANSINVNSYNSGISFGGWVKWNGGGSGFLPFFGWDYTLSWGSVYLMVDSGGNLSDRFGCGSSSCAHAAGTLLPNVWYHVFGTHDTSYDKLYLNGALVDQSPSGTLTGNQTYFTIGAVNQGSRKFFPGYIDDVRIYSRALTQTEIQQIYNGGSGTEAE